MVVPREGTLVARMVGLKAVQLAELKVVRLVATLVELKAVT